MELITLAKQILELNKKLMLLDCNDDAVFFPESVQVYKGHEICLSLRNDIDLTIDTKEKICLFKIRYTDETITFHNSIDIPKEYEFIKGVLLSALEEIVKFHIQVLKEKKSYQIYKITNKINGKCYIGKSINLCIARWKDHMTNNKSKISKAIKSEGIENFIFEVIEAVKFPEHIDSEKKIDEYVIERERFHINAFDSLNNGYNSRM